MARGTKQIRVGRVVRFVDDLEFQVRSINLAISECDPKDETLIRLDVKKRTIQTIIDNLKAEFEI